MTGRPCDHDSNEPVVLYPMISPRKDWVQSTAVPIGNWWMTTHQATDHMIIIYNYDNYDDMNLWISVNISTRLLDPSCHLSPVTCTSAGHLGHGSLGSTLASSAQPQSEWFDFSYFRHWLGLPWLQIEPIYLTIWSVKPDLVNPPKIAEIVWRLPDPVSDELDLGSLPLELPAGPPDHMTLRSKLLGGKVSGRSSYLLSCQDGATNAKR